MLAGEPCAIVDVADVQEIETTVGGADHGAWRQGRTPHGERFEWEDVALAFSHKHSHCSAFLARSTRDVTVTL